MRTQMKCERIEDVRYEIGKVNFTTDKRVEEAFKKLSNIVEQTADHVIITDKNGVIEYVNPAFERLTGYTKEEAIGKTPRIVRSGQHDEGFYKALWKTILSGRVFRGILINRKKDGGLFYEEKTITPIRDSQGKITHFVSTSKDITQRQQVEKERAVLLEETQRHVQRLALLSEITQAINSTLEIRVILDLLIDKIDNLLPYSAASIRLLNIDTGELEPKACRNIDEEGWTLSIAEEVTKNKCPVPRINMRTDPDTRDFDFFRVHGLVSYLGVPMLAKGKILGVLNFYTREEYQFNNEEIDFLTTLANQAAIAINNCRLYEQVKRKTHELSTLHAVTATASQSLDLSTVLQDVAIKITEIFHFEGTYIFLSNPESDTFCQQANYAIHSEKIVNKKVYPIGQGIIGWVAKSGEPLLFEDIQSDPLYEKLAKTRAAKDAGFRFLIALPIKRKEQVLGVIVSIGQKPCRLPLDQRQLIMSMANQIGIAVENATLFEATEVKAKEISALFSVATVINQCLDLGFLLHSVMEKVLEVFDFDGARIYLFDEEGKKLRLLAHQGFPKDAVPSSSLKPGQGLFWRVFEKGGPIFFEDIQTDPMFHRMNHKGVSQRAGFRGSFSIPLKVKDKTVGVINFVSKNVRRFSPSKVQLIHSIANQLGVALENAQLYEQTKKQTEELRSFAAHLQSVREDERTRVAREVHDQLGQSLAALKLDLSWLSKRLSENQGFLLERTKSMSGLINSTIRTVRRISADLRPSVLDDFGLVTAMEWQVDEFQTRTEIKCNMVLPPKDTPLDPRRATAIFRIFQEILTNVARHACATKVSVSLKEDGSELILEVKDNGKGITKSAISNSKSLGLLGMRERALLLGGLVNLSRNKGKGTMVTVRIPLVKHIASVIPQPADSLARSQDTSTPSLPVLGSLPSELPG